MHLWKYARESINLFKVNDGNAIDPLKYLLEKSLEKGSFPDA